MKNTRYFAVAALAFAACGEDAAPVEKREVTVESMPAMPVDHPEIDSLKLASRGPRRLSVAQIERSVEKIADIPAGSVVLDRGLALALGRPDFLRVTEESLEPSPLFMKFLMDLGGYVCTALTDLDKTRVEADRVLRRFADDDRNIRQLVVRFTGIDGERAEPYVARLREVYTSARTSTRGDDGGWEAVCMALFTSPEFLVY